MRIHYIHDLAGNIIAEYNAYIANEGREYIWSDEGPVAVIDQAGTTNAQMFQVHTDHLERPIMMTDGSKNIVWKATYLPFGGVYTITGSETLNHRFPGQ